MSVCLLQLGVSHSQTNVNVWCIDVQVSANSNHQSVYSYFITDQSLQPWSGGRHNAPQTARYSTLLVGVVYYVIVI